MLYQISTNIQRKSNEVYVTVEFKLHKKQHTQLDFYSASSLKQPSVGKHSNQFVLLLLNAAYLAEKKQIPIL